jgi:hypothetical protein
MFPKNHLRALILGLATAFALQAGTGSASANNDLKVCSRDDGGGTCLYRTSYDSSFKNDECPWPSCVDNPYQSSFNDTISSVSNRTDYWWKLYEDIDYGGFALCIRPHGWDSDLGNNTAYEDKISSVKNKYTTSKPYGCDQVIG